jgi:hypothetical protein
LLDKFQYALNEFFHSALSPISASPLALDWITGRPSYAETSRARPKAAASSQRRIVLFQGVKLAHGDFIALDRVLSELLRHDEHAAIAIP